MDSRAFPLHNVHVVLGAGVVAVQAQGSPEVGPQLVVPRDQRADYFSAGEQKREREKELTNPIRTTAAHVQVG